MAVAKRRKRRKVRRVDNSGQLILCELEKKEKKLEEESDQREGKRRYRDPSPEKILIGGEDLGSYLEERGEGEALELRELLRSLELKGLHKKAPSAGRRRYHPASLLGLILLGILEGKSSLRELEKLARTDLRAFWVTGGIQPDHSVVGRFIQENREVLSEEFFVELTQEILKKTKRGGGDLSGDGTVIEAASSSYRVLKQEAAEEAAREAEKAHRENPEDAQLARRSEEARKVAETARERREARRANRARGEVGVSPSDPEAVIQPLKKGGKAPSYKPVILTNAEQIVVAQKVDPSCEHGPYEELLKQAEASSGPVKRLRLDAGFFNFEVLESSEEARIDLLCPPTIEPGKKRKSGLYHKSEFHYVASEDYYECPAGHRLVARGGGKDRGRAYRRYGGAPCGECRQRDRCTRSQKRGRTIKRYESEELKEALREKMATETAQQEYGKRKLIEIVFARIKEHLGLRRFRRRGLAAVGVEFALYAAAYNFSRLRALRPAMAEASSRFQPLYDLSRRILRRLGPRLHFQLNRHSPVLRVA